MIRITLSILLTFLCINLFSQSAHSIGLNIGTTHSFRVVNGDLENSALSENLILNKADDNTKTQFTAGLTYSYKLSEKLSLNSGLQYVNLGYNVPDAFFQYPNDNPFAGEKTNERDYLTIHTISVPLTLSYDLLNTEKSSLSVGGGVTLAYIAREKNNKFFTQDSEEYEIFDNVDYTLKPLQIGGIVDLTYSYKINEKHSLSISPSFNYNFTKNKYYGVEENLYTFRTVVGINHQF